MENPIIKTVLTVVAIVAAVMWTNSCYYDNEQYLYGECDTTAVTYTSNIAPIMAASCNSCHTGAYASGGIVTSTYDGLKAAAQTGQLWGAVSHAPGFSPMPPSGVKLGACELNRIKAWINQGMIEQ